MTTLRTILTLLTIGSTFQLFGQGVGKDTTFLFKKMVGGELHTVFIDNHADSKYYDPISYFGFRSFDERSYQYSTAYFKKHNLTLTKVKPVIASTQWVALEQYKGDFYVYHPCDFNAHSRKSVNDSTFIDWTGEGPVANKILEQRKIDNKTYLFKLTGIVHPERTLVIHLIDPQKGIAVFEESTAGEEKGYYLMIAADKIKSVPIIVNYCDRQKQVEWQFGEPDFKALLKTN